MELMDRRTLAVVALSAAVGAFVGALAAVGVAGLLNALDEDSLTVEDRLRAIEMTFDREWPRVEDYEDWYVALYNSHEELELEFTGLSELIQERGIDFARDKVEDWRRRYALWVERVGERLTSLSVFSDLHEGVETIHFRGNHVLGHIDAILDG